MISNLHRKVIIEQNFPHFLLLKKKKIVPLKSNPESATANKDACISTLSNLRYDVYVRFPFDCAWLFIHYIYIFLCFFNA